MLHTGFAISQRLTGWLTTSHATGTHVKRTGAGGPATSSKAVECARMRRREEGARFTTGAAGATQSARVTGFTADTCHSAPSPATRRRDPRSGPAECSRVVECVHVRRREEGGRFTTGVASAMPSARVTGFTADTCRRAPSPGTIRRDPRSGPAECSRVVECMHMRRREEGGRFNTGAASATQSSDDGFCCRHAPLTVRPAGASKTSNKAGRARARQGRTLRATSDAGKQAPSPGRRRCLTAVWWWVACQHGQAGADDARGGHGKTTGEARRARTAGTYRARRSRRCRAGTEPPPPARFELVCRWLAFHHGHAHTDDAVRRHHKTTGEAGRVRAAGTFIARCICPVEQTHRPHRRCWRNAG